MKNQKSILKNSSHLYTYQYLYPCTLLFHLPCVNPLHSYLRWQRLLFECLPSPAWGSYNSLLLYQQISFYCLLISVIEQTFSIKDALLPHFSHPYTPAIQCSLLRKQFPTQVVSIHCLQFLSSHSLSFYLLKSSPVLKSLFNCSIIF